VSRRSRKVSLFTDPISGEQPGYYNGWGDDGCFHYTGEANLAINA